MPNQSAVTIVANREVFVQHNTGFNHPESPQRVVAIEEALKKAGLMTNENTIFPRKATEDEIYLCHDIKYIEELKRQIESLKVQGKRIAAFDQTICHENNVAGDFHICPKSLTAAIYAAGAPLTAIEHILNKENRVSSAFCINRPPGHHAHRGIGSGFCLLNNIAIAAKYLTKILKFQRILIVDWDAHHGDGTQELTENDEKIFYFSTHKDTAKGFYPGPHWGRSDQKGTGLGEGTVLNFPVSGSKNQCREAIMSAFRFDLLEAMGKYQPEFLLISCGFDAHENDSLVGLGLKDEDYFELTTICKKIADKYASGRIVSILEGGYNLQAIASAAVKHVAALKHEEK